MRTRLKIIFLGVSVGIKILRTGFFATVSLINIFCLTSSNVFENFRSVLINFCCKLELGMIFNNCLPKFYSEDVRTILSKYSVQVNKKPNKTSIFIAF